MTLPDDEAAEIRVDQTRQNIKNLRAMAAESDQPEARHWYGRAADLLEKGLHRSTPRVVV